MDTENLINTARNVQTPGKNKPTSASIFKTPQKFDARPKSATCSKLGAPQRTPLTCQNSNTKLGGPQRVPLSPLNCSGSLMSTFSTISTSNSVTTSDAREAARLAKLQSTSSRIQKVQELKEKWAKEKEVKAAHYKEKRAKEQKKLQDESELSTELRRKNLERQKEIEEREKSNKHEILQASLEAHVQLSMDLEKQTKAKRRISVFLNQQMRKRATAKEAEMNSQKKEYEDKLLYDRRVDYLQVREMKKAEELRRRESLANQTIQAIEVKKKVEELEQEQKFQEFTLLEMRKLNFEDEQVYKKQLEENRRQSLAGRLDKWREEKQREKQQKEEEALAKEYEDELQRQAREDMKQFKVQQEENRRCSLAYRLDKAKKDKNVEQGMKTMESMIAAEEHRIQELDRKDMANYRQRIQEACRQSLEYRNQQNFQERLRMEGVQHSISLVEQSDREIRYEGWKDVRKYQETQRDAARHSLAWRLADAHRQQEIALVKHQEKLLHLHYDIQARREDWLALRKCQQEENESRRKSLQMRLASWKTVNLQEAKREQQKEMQQEENALEREIDREELMAIKLANEMMESHMMLASISEEFTD